LPLVLKGVSCGYLELFIFELMIPMFELDEDTRFSEVLEIFEIDDVIFTVSEI
jgi:hypothetical protein